MSGPRASSCAILGQFVQKAIGWLFDFTVHNELSGKGFAKVFFVFHADRWARQQSFGFNLNQFAGDDKEFGAEVRINVFVLVDISEELIGYFCQGKLGDVELCFLDEVQKKVKRS